MDLNETAVISEKPTIGKSVNIIIYDEFSISPKSFPQRSCFAKELKDEKPKEFFSHKFFYLYFFCSFW